MKTRIFKFLNLGIILFFSSCDMKTELDVTSIAFPPKLSVTAILDGGNGSFSITFTEGRALADYAKPFPDNREIIRNGEIRLYEDGILIWSKQGTFDMSVRSIVDYWGEILELPSINGYCYIEHGMATRAGSTYRLEIEVEGYETAAATAIMPDAPLVTASADISSTVMKDKINNIRSLNEHTAWNARYTNSYWPVTVQFTDPNPDERKYFALDICKKTDDCHEGVHLLTVDDRHPIGAAELSKLQDNPEVEAEEMLMDTDAADLYYFMLLLQSNVTFSRGNNILNYYMGDERPPYDCSDAILSDPIPDWIWVTSHEKYSLRVKRITSETFRYYRSLTLQNAGMGFFTEPVTVVGNIEKGYGCFSVINSVIIPLLEYETCYYRAEEYYGN